MTIKIPPIKCQGIKSKLVPWILTQPTLANWSGSGRWIEPFMGSGVVGFNLQPDRALFCDHNVHLIRFYQAVQTGEIKPEIIREFLEAEGAKLQTQGEAYYYAVRDRFNQHYHPLDFLFLNRACFNGVIRFNSRGRFNVPFGHKPARFAKAYITKIVNQVTWVQTLVQSHNWQFCCQDFRQTVAEAEENDFLYCDPPYAGRHVDYFNHWHPEDEQALFQALSATPAQFMLSTWHSNQHRDNPGIQQFWRRFHLETSAHFYHVGAKETNRKPMIEALVSRG